MTMNRLNFFLMTAITAATILSSATSCISEGSEPADRSRAELRLSSGVEVQTRAAFTAANTQIPNGQTVSVYVDDAGSGTPQLYGNNELTADGSGNLSGGTPMYFPDNGHGVNIYAFHTGATLAGTFPASALTHTVSSDQSTLAGYVSSDLLYARRTGVARTSSAVALTFYHLLSKLQVAIVAGDGLTDSDIKGLTVGGTKPGATFTPGKSTVPADMTVSAAGTAAGITVQFDVSPNFTAPVYNEAVIVPQTVSAGTVFITVHLDSGDLVYRLPSDVTFEKGKIYEYRITARLTGLTLTSTIEDWTPVGTPETGNAETE
jgi:hypothetical protein